MNKEQLISSLSLAISSRNIQELETLSKTAVENFPDDAFGYVYLSAYFSMIDVPEFSKAEICIVKAIELEPSNADFYTRFSELKFAQGNIEESRLLNLKALQFDANNVSALTSLGKYELYNADLYDNAIKYLAKAVEIQPDNRKANLYLAYAFYKKGNFSDALVSISVALKGEFDEEVTLVYIDILESLYDTKQLIEAFDMLVLKNPNNPQYRFRFAKHLFDANIFEETVVQIKKGIELSSSNLSYKIYLPLLKSLFILDKKDEFFVIINDLITNNNAEIELYELRINANVSESKLESALDDTEKIIQIINDFVMSADYQIQKAYLLLKLNRKEEAINIFEQLTANELTAKDGLFNLGMMSLKSEDFPKAYDLLKKARLYGSFNAEKIIYENLYEYLDSVREKLLNENINEVQGNLKSVFLNKIFGKLWIFNELDSQAMKSVSEVIVNNVIDSLKSFTLFMTEIGGVLVKSIQTDSFTYKIISENQDSAKIHFIMLDGSKTMDINLSLQNGILHFSERDGEILKFTELSLKDIPEYVEDAYLRTLVPEEMEFMGEKGNSIIQHFFGEINS
jgi:tetratricopeptide (TPR) repeat protein